MPLVRSREYYDIFSTIGTEDTNIEDKLVVDQIHTDVKNLIDHLPAEQQEVLRMRIYQNLSFKEISECTDVSINTALGRMRYAVINLKKLVAENGIQLTQY